MTYDLFIGDRTFSSWSLRGWLMFDGFGLDCRVHMVGLYDGTMARDMTGLAPARLVPTLRLPDGTVISETMAIAETLAERHPEIAFWPKDASLRATARWLAAEMCSGFGALREACPMQLLHVFEGFQPDQATLADLERIETLWRHAWAKTGSDAGWLFGDWSLADAFYAPVVARIVGYDLPVGGAARAYCDRVLAHRAVHAWRAEGLKVRYDPIPYDMDLARRPWPGDD